MQAVLQIAARVLGPGRSDASPANANGGKMACGRTYAIECLFSSRDQDIQRLRAFTEWSHDPSLIRNSRALDFGILDDRAATAGGVAARLSRN